MTRLEDVTPGTVLTGRVSNVTDFGAFVDIGNSADILRVFKWPDKSTTNYGMLDFKSYIKICNEHIG